MPSPFKVPCLSHEVKRKYPRDKRTFVQYRISLYEHDRFLEMAKDLHDEGQIPQPTISCLAKSALITLWNMRMKTQQANQELREEQERKTQELNKPITPYELEKALFIADKLSIII